MIPVFPEFRILSLADKVEIENFTSRYEPYSDFNFVSMWTWDTSSERAVAELNGNLVVRFTDYITDEPFLSFIGATDSEKTALELLAYARTQGIPDKLRLVPEQSVSGMRDGVLTIQEDRDNFDYIYSVSDLSALSGSKYEMNRKMIRRFQKSIPDSRIEFVDLKSDSVVADIRKLLDVWEKRKINKTPDFEIQHELDALHRLFETAASHKLLVSGVFSQDVMLGFSIEEQLLNGYCMGHFWKADIEQEGIYDYFLHMKARHFEAMGLRYINYEQDLGLPGLRTSKMSYRPVNFLKKYTVRLAEGVHSL